jgi:hypothetical protein
MSLRGFADTVGARRVQLPGLVNINRPDDLPVARHGSSTPGLDGLADTPGEG